MGKRSAENAGGDGLESNSPSIFTEEGKSIVLLPDESATKVSCNVFKFLSMKGFRTYFIDNRNATSFRALRCKPLGFSAMVELNDVGPSGRMIHFFLNDTTRRNPLINTDEQPWRVANDEGEVCKMEPLVSFEDLMKVRAIAVNAFNALKCTFSKKTDAELRELHFQFGKPKSGHWKDKLVLTGVITSEECRVTWGGSTKEFERSNFYLAMLTEKLFS